MVNAHCNNLFHSQEILWNTIPSHTRSPLDLAFGEHQIPSCVPSAAPLLLKAQPLCCVSFPNASVGMFLPLPE